jgi:hypothetical protein
MKIRNLITKLSPLAIAALVGFSGCSDSGTRPLEMSTAELAWQNQTVQDGTPDLLNGIDIEGAYTDGIFIDDAVPAKASGAVPVRILNYVDKLETEVTKSNRRWLLKSQFIGPDGGTITFGTDKVGYSTLTFPAGAVDEEVLITVVHKLKGKRDLFFFPDQDFDAPVTLSFNLTSLNRTQIHYLLSLKLYHHVKGKGWVEVKRSFSDGGFVVARLMHFSRYAVGSDR